MTKLSDRPKLADSILLFGIEILSTLPYLFGLGFYLDDWDTLSRLVPRSGQRLGTMIWNGFQADPAARPMAIVYQVVEFKAFGQHATSYHIVNSVALGIVSVLLYLVLRELSVGRWLAFATASIFTVLPHYSTDRVWIASHQTMLSMLFALLGMYALFRLTHPCRRIRGMWVAVAVVAILLSTLCYEVPIALIAASLALAGWRGYKVFRASSEHDVSRFRAIALATGILLAAGIVKSRLQTRMPYRHHFFTHLGALCRHAIDQAIRFNFRTYGLHLPAVLEALWRQSVLTPIALAIAALIACLVATRLWHQVESSSVPTPRTCLWLIALGFVLFGLGYALFFPSIQANFSTAGLDNRVAIVSALGVSVTWIAVVGLACSLLKSGSTRARAFSLAIGLICGVNSLAVSGIGLFWANAAAQQSAILKSVAANVPLLPHGSVLLLDGFCRFRGPGIVFAMDWDTTGAVQLTLADSSLSGDVVSRDLHFDFFSVRKIIAGNSANEYVYGSNLFVYNVRSQALTNLSSGGSAAAYLRAMNPTGNSGCPAGDWEDGTKVF